VKQRPWALAETDVTPEPLYVRRREFLSLGAAGAVGLAGSALSFSCQASAKENPSPTFSNLKRGNFGTDEKQTPFTDITTYNNYYEFGTAKSDPAENAGSFHTRPWTIALEGEINNPEVVDVDELIKRFPLEERIYRMRCVEAWSMVIPWVGFPLADLIKRANPTSNAKYVAFTTKHDPQEMPGQKRNVLDWPYVEGLRLDEAIHPLAILAVGLYGRVLPNQNGAPLRLVVPWKYGFKGIKAIVKIAFLKEEPKTTWNKMAPGEYGFYANVNPEVDHPRWSQSKERRIGEFFKRKTLPFNGYAEQVAKLYAGMDLRKSF
jgi:methionine sulfoxide reductase catalytic subunit